MTNPCQRIATLCFLMVDGAATLITMIHSSLTMVIVLLAFTTSALFALLASSVNSVLWPTYFWDETNTRPMAAAEQHRLRQVQLRRQSIRE